MRPLHPLDADKFHNRAFSALQNEAWFRARMAFVDGHSLDERTIEAHVGTLTVLPAYFAGPRFDLDEIMGVQPALSVVCEVLGADGMTAVDLVAWPIDEPKRVATLAGHAAVLGLNQALCHPMSVFSSPLKVHRGVVGWLRNACIGIVLIDLQRAAWVLRDTEGEIEAEDYAHGVEIHAAIETVRHPIIVVAKRRRQREAA